RLCEPLDQRSAEIPCTTRDDGRASAQLGITQRGFDHEVALTHPAPRCILPSSAASSRRGNLLECGGSMPLLTANLGSLPPDAPPKLPRPRRVPPRRHVGCGVEPRHSTCSRLTRVQLGR